ncbi:Lanosterol 14-alpha demethylase [Nonomuraea coxensis DSM 45129]|uniref:Lanosterol 14-alpha demethylase n=1 Tax=Nonomuraea coxensis DSM 45129 TaxID=1122611 RepID=A0ABX8TZW7_9ACTN|nr:cytochrome P450 [Nonomuraea coxensis]QYC40980.1 Lanosterol 14-alpha demethylase [Nonomuraea coxensis DSM 45129]
MDAARPPGPRGHWLLGNVADYERDRVSFLRRGHREHGDVLSFDDRIVFTVDPRLAHQVLKATNRDYVTEPAPFAGGAVPREAGEEIRPWMRARRVLRPALTGDAAACLDARTVAILDDVLDGTAGRSADVLPLMLGFTGRAVAELCLGPDAAGVPGLLAEVYAALLPFENAGYQLPPWLPSARRRRFVRVHRRVAGVLAGLVAARRGTAAGSPPDLLDVLLAARPAMGDGEVVSTLWSVLIGGHGVPAAALTSLVRDLALHPALATALAAEAGAPRGAGPRSGAGALRGGGVVRALLPVAEAVVKETLRLTPPAWTMSRIACVPVALGPWRLRPGDEVLSTPYLIHRDPRWWPRAEEFDPSRWRDARPAAGTYLPFGAGPRYCLGSVVALRQLTLAASRIAQRFDVHAPAAASAEPAFCGRLAPAGLRAEFRPRAHAAR